jgi:5-methylcytosine-specific restriction protein A
MPYKSKKPCAVYGCPNLTLKKYCEKHEKEINSKDNRQQYLKNKYRYDSNWRKISKAYLQAYPLCENCKAEGRLIPAELVHHVIPIENGGTHNLHNLMSVCKSCHNAIHNQNGEKGFAANR